MRLFNKFRKDFTILRMKGVCDYPNNVYLDIFRTNSNRLRLFLQIF